jgi:hypothetical protein
MRSLRSALATLVVIVTVLFARAGAAQAFPTGDVFVSVANGQVQQWHPNDGTSTLVTTLDTTKGGFTTGSTFDNAGNFYVTGFSTSAVSKFDSSGTLVGDFGNGYSTPESILWNRDNSAAYVGDAGTTLIRSFDPSGNPGPTYTVAVEDRGTDWIDLDADQCTMYYTSEGSFVHRFNICTNTQETDVNTAPLPGSVAFAFRKIPSTLSFQPNGYVIADTGNIAVLDASGNLAAQYSFPGENCLFALNLDPDGVHAWTGDYCTADVLRFNLSTGTVDNSFNTGTGGDSVFGISVSGEITSGGGGGGGGAKSTSTTYTGGASVQYSDPVTVSGTLLDTSVSPNIGIAGKQLDFTIGTHTAHASPTDANGNASTSLQVLQKPGSVTTVQTAFAGDATYKPSSDSDPFSITKEDCTLKYSGDILVPPATMSNLAADMGEPDSSLGDRSNKTVTFTVIDSALNTQTFSATTDASGHASITVPLFAGVYGVSASFAGDDYYNACSTPTDTLVTVEAAAAKVTGGGWISIFTGRTSFGFNAIPQAGGLFSGQFQLRSNNGKNRFHGNVVTNLSSSGNTATWSGTGDWNGQPGYTFTISVVDNGSSGSKKLDTISITITSPTNAVVYTTGGAQVLKGGNVTVHQ